MAESRIYRMHVLNRCNGFLEIEDWRRFLLLDISKRKWSLVRFARGIRIKIPHQMVELNFLPRAHKTCSQHQPASVHTDPFFAANRIHVPAKVLPLPMSCHSQECFTIRPFVLTAFYMAITWLHWPAFTSASRKIERLWSLPTVVRSKSAPPRPATELRLLWDLSLLIHGVAFWPDLCQMCGTIVYWLFSTSSISR